MWLPLEIGFPVQSTANVTAGSDRRKLLHPTKDLCHHVLLSLQVLDVIAPPYTSDFVQLFLPILENESIAGTIKAEGEHDPVTEFIGRKLHSVPFFFPP